MENGSDPQSRPAGHGSQDPLPGGSRVEQNAEKDLWDFGNESMADLPVRPRFAAKLIDRRKAKPRGEEPAVSGEPSDPRDSGRSGSVAPMRPSRIKEVLRAPSESEWFGDLGGGQPQEPAEDEAARREVQGLSETPPASTGLAMGQEVPSAAPGEAELAETDVAAVPVQPQRGAKATMIDRIAVTVLAVLLLAAGAVFLRWSVGALPSRPLFEGDGKFPVKGSRLVVTDAETYWREPVRSGERIDLVQRDAKVIPEIRLSLAGGPCAVRVMFRDGDGNLIGDAVTRGVEGEGEIKIAATGGFADSGMHASYRMQGVRPWTAEVYEGPDVGSSGESFSRIFEMRISTDLR